MVLRELSEQIYLRLEELPNPQQAVLHCVAMYCEGEKDLTKLVSSLTYIRNCEGKRAHGYSAVQANYEDIVRG